MFNEKVLLSWLSCTRPIKTRLLSRLVFPRFFYAALSLDTKYGVCVGGNVTNLKLTTKITQNIDEYGKSKYNKVWLCKAEFMRNANATSKFDEYKQSRHGNGARTCGQNKHLPCKWRFTIIALLNLLISFVLSSTQMR